MNNWNFGDGTVLSSTDITVMHCYTNVNTYTNINTTPTVTLSVSGQPPAQKTINHNNCQNGVFIGAIDGTSPTNLTSYSAVLPGILYNGLTNTRDVHVYATVWIDKPFTFYETDITMAPGAGFSIGATGNNTYSLTLEKNTIIGVKQGCGCQWRGIQLHGGSLFVRLNSTLKDALYAVAVRSKKVVDIRDSNFENNYIGIFAYGSQANMDFYLSGNNFYSNSTILPWCGGPSLLGEGDPYIPSYGDFFTDRGWAGICYYGANTKAIGNGNINTFRGLANGIVLNGSSVGTLMSPGSISGGISLCKFEGIARGNYPASNGGNGIFFLDRRGVNHMRQTGSGLGNVSNPSFDGCEVGIHVISRSGMGNSTIISSNNRMTNTELGYRITNLSGTGFASITSNYIHASQDFSNGNYKGGVQAGLFGQLAATNCHISNNTILVDQPMNSGVGFIQGIRIINNAFSSAIPANGNITVNDNQITMSSNGSSGIVVANLGSPVVQGNTVTVADVQTTIGIFDGGCTNGSILCNDVFGPLPNLNNVRSGINALFATDATIRDNHITNFDRGAAFDFDCGTVDFSCNDILGNNVNGLFYNSNATTGPQEDRGNVWDCTSLDFEARNQNTLTYLLDFYTAEEGTNAFPKSQFPSDWFTDSTNPTPNCPTNPTCPLTLIPPDIHAQDVAIADGQYNINLGMLNSMEKTLYIKLKENPNLLIGDSLMQSFLNVRANGPIGKFYDLREGMSGLFAVPNATQDHLEDYLVDIQANLQQMGVLDSILATNPPEPQYSNYQQQNDQLGNQNSLIYEAIDTIYSGLYDAQLALADSLLAVNNAIFSTTIADQNEKQVYDIFLNTLAKGILEATPAELATLANIASQCVEDGGRPVWWAILLHNYFTGSNLAIPDCNSEVKGNPIALQHKNENEFVIFPNPTSGTCKISYQLEKEQKGEFKVFDLYGHILGVYNIESPSVLLSLDDLSSGAYIVQFSINGKLVKSEKLIKY